MDMKAIVGGLVVLVIGALVATFSRQFLWFVLAALVSAYLVIVWRNWFGPRYYAIASRLLVCVAAAAIVGGLWWNHLSEPSAQGPFSIAVKASIKGTREKGIGFHVVYGEAGGARKYPISAMLFVAVTNRQAIHSQIERIAVDGLGRDGQWHRLARFPLTEGGRVYSDGPNPSAALEVAGETPFLDRLLEREEMKPGGSSRGWVAVEYPAGLQLSEASVGCYRIIVTDAAAVNYSSGPLPVETNNEGFGAAELQVPALQMMNPTIDLTSLKTGHLN